MRNVTFTRVHSSACDCFFFQAEDGIRDLTVTGVQTCALPIWILFKPSGMPGSSSSLDRYSVREKVQGGKRCGARSIEPCYVSVAMDAPMLEAHREDRKSVV